MGWQPANAERRSDEWRSSCLPWSGEPQEENDSLEGSGDPMSVSYNTMSGYHKLEGRERPAGGELQLWQPANAERRPDEWRSSCLSWSGEPHRENDSLKGRGYPMSSRVTTTPARSTFGVGHHEEWLARVLIWCSPYPVGAVQGVTLMAVENEYSD